jgi:hypothetical protein
MCGQCTCLVEEGVPRHVMSCREVVGLPADLAPSREAVADAGFQAGLAPEDGPPGRLASAAEPPGGLDAAIRAIPPDHPSQSRAAN